MCSILAIISNNELSHHLLDQASNMLNTTVHRGPDDSDSIVIKDKVYLGSNRLSIIGLSVEGRMPLKSYNRDCWIVFNGEIYNYKELRLELQHKGFIFKSSTDTEVVLNSYLLWGEDFIQKLNGMFAFVIYDFANNKTIAGRDRFGIKPLYYTFYENSIVYSSDFLVLKKLHSKGMDLNYSALTAYVKCRFVPGKLTILNNIFKLEPAEIQVTEIHNLSQSNKKFWKPVFQPACFSQSTFNTLLDKAIESAIQADVQPTILLSGGLDSSAILAILHKKGYKNIQNFTCTFSDSKKLKENNKLFNSITTPNIDEREFAYLISNKFEYKIESFTIDSNIEKETFLNMQSALGEPIASPNALGLFLFGQKLKGSTKLSISGTGSDELLGGYQNLYFQDNFSDFNSQNPLDLLNYFADFDNGGVDPLKYLNQDLLELNYLNQYTELSMEGISKEEFPNELLNQLLIFELAFALPGWELDQADRLFMHNSIELRPAFLDNSFVEYCLSIPSASKAKKEPLKQAMINLLPNSILKREKYPGLGTPFSINDQLWFKELKEDLFFNPLDLWDKSYINKLSNVKNSELSFDVLYRLIYLQSWVKNIAQ